ncbi:ATP-dependent DNA ligase [Candidatus Micrarchaeota archaeon]|nr:ATP-dependent DNA ligase [Candidatus Micrarchaeota archaeon]
MKTFRSLASLFSELEEISSYNEKRDKLAGFLENLEPKEVKRAAYLTLGTIGADYEDTDLGIAGKMAIQAVGEAYDEKEKKINKMLDKMGDLGDVVQKIDSKTSSRISIKEVFSALQRIQRASGEGSQGKKIEILAGLLKDAGKLGAKFITRIVLGKTRLGIGEQMVLDSFAVAFTGDSGNKDTIEDAYNKCNDIGELGGSLAENGLSSAKRYSIVLGRPVKPMLAQRVDKVSDILERVQTDEIAAEEKYDGERVQLHKDGDKVIAFSRRLNDISRQFPEIVEAAAKQIKAEKAVLDGEIVAYENGEIKPFQKLMHRRRKHDIEKYREKIPVAVFLFDAIYIEGKSLLKKPYPERRKRLEKIIRPSKRIKLARRKVSTDFQEIKGFFKKCIEGGLEGIIVKSVAKKSVYQPGKRGWLWIKWKKEYAEGMQDTFDLVVIGSYHGKGSRKGHFGALLCAAYNKEKDRFETFTKVGSGYKDKDFPEIEKKLKKHKVREPPPNVRIADAMKPDIFYEPGLVVEVLGANITTSTGHTAGRDGDKGLALRFPRFVSLRPDKKPDDATTIKEIRSIKNG